MSRIDLPGIGPSFPGEVEIAGLAFAGDRGITQVEVSTDAGQSWHGASLEPPLGPLTWVFWHYTTRFDEVGTHTARVRATDGTGTVQTSHESDPYPNGATGFDQEAIHIQSLSGHD
jgi:hypothetical protein